MSKSIRLQRLRKFVDRISPEAAEKLGPLEAVAKRVRSQKWRLWTRKEADIEKIMDVLRVFYPSPDDPLFRLESATDLRLRDAREETAEEHAQSCIGPVKELFHKKIEGAMATLPCDAALRSAVSDSVWQFGLGSSMHAQITRKYDRFGQLEVHGTPVSSTATRDLDAAVFHYVAVITGAQPLIDPVLLLEVLSSCVIIGTRSNGMAVGLIHD